MKRYLYTALAVALLATTLFSARTPAVAKIVVKPRIYMFGFSASFNDSIVYFTDIQPVDSACIDTKTKFLQERESYSYQLRDYLALQLQAPHRTCFVMYHVNRSKLEKEYAKLKKLYSTPTRDGRLPYDVRQLNASDFRFQTVSVEVAE